MLVAVVNTKVFEKCGSKNYLSCYGKELSTDATHALTQLLKSLSKVIGFNVLDVVNENTSEPFRLFPKVIFF